MHDYIDYIIVDYDTIYNTLEYKFALEKWQNKLPV